MTASTSRHVPDVGQMWHTGVLRDRKDRIVRECVHRHEYPWREPPKFHREFPGFTIDQEPAIKCAWAMLKEYNRGTK